MAAKLWARFFLIGQFLNIYHESLKSQLLYLKNCFVKTFDKVPGCTKCFIQNKNTM